MAGIFGSSRFFCGPVIQILYANDSDFSQLDLSPCNVNISNFTFLCFFQFLQSVAVGKCLLLLWIRNFKFQLEVFFG